MPEFSLAGLDFIVKNCDAPIRTSSFFDYIRNWRRSLGVVLLMFTCLCTSFWVRSIDITDDVLIVLPGRYRLVMISQDRALQLFFRCNGALETEPPQIIWRAYVFRPNAIDTELVTWTFRAFGLWFGRVSQQLTHPDSIWVVIVSYWTIIGPLIPISSYLLLSTPTPTDGQISTPEAHNTALDSQGQGEVASSSAVGPSLEDNCNRLLSDQDGRVAMKD